MASFTSEPSATGRRLEQLEKTAHGMKLLIYLMESFNLLMDNSGDARAGWTQALSDGGRPGRQAAELAEPRFHLPEQGSSLHMLTLVNRDADRSPLPGGPSFTAVN